MTVPRPDLAVVELREWLRHRPSHTGNWSRNDEWADALDAILAEREALEAERECPVQDTYPVPEHGWVCFHCSEHFPATFAGVRAAAAHFGAGYIDSIPGCRLRMRKGELSLLRRIRWLERELRTLRARVADEDTDKDKR